MVSDNHQRGVRSFRGVAAASLVLATLLAACGGPASEEDVVQRGAKAIATQGFYGFALICKPPGPRAYVLIRPGSLVLSSARPPLGAHVLSAKPDGEAPPDAKVIVDAPSDETTAGDSPVLIEHFEHVASKESIIGDETCIADLKELSDPNSFLIVRSERGDVKARYVPERELPLCFSYSKISLFAGDVFTVDVYSGSPPDVCPLPSMADSAK